MSGKRGAQFYLSEDPALSLWDGAARRAGASRSALAEAVAVELLGGEDPVLPADVLELVWAVLCESARDIGAERHGRRI